MLFQNILNEKYSLLKLEFIKLYEMAFNNQTHPGDLLLVHQNGFYNPEVYEWDNIPEKLSPYMVGPGSEGHSESTHHDFIGHYVNNNTTQEAFEDYLKRVAYDPTKVHETHKLEIDEGISIQTEMLIYLKIWESDAFIKTLYELVRLMKGEPYDWHFKIKESNRDKSATGNRDAILRELVRDQFKSILPIIYEAFKTAFKTQLRNAIAHSQYIILGRHITLNNYVKEDVHAQIRSVSFDEWVNIFHETIIIYSVYNELLTTILKEYGTISMQNNNTFEIRVNKVLPQKETLYRAVEYDPHFRLWR